MKRRGIAIFVILLATVMLLAPAASANGPAPAPWFSVYLSNLPAETYYVDLLIPLSETDPMYTDLVTENVPEGFSPQAEIVSYCEGGYRSYTFHYKDAYSNIRPIQTYGQQPQVYFCYQGSGQALEVHTEDLENRGSVKLALLDAQGNILKVSQAQSTAPEGLFTYSLKTFRYDCAADSLTLDSANSGTAILIYLAVSFAGLVFTCLAEWCVGAGFGLTKAYGRPIVGINVLSQVLMRVIFVALYGALFRRYVPAIAALEALVYCGEFLFYRLTMREVPWKKCLLFTLAANTVSLVLGIVINKMLLPV